MRHLFLLYLKLSHDFRYKNLPKRYFINCHQITFDHLCFAKYKQKVANDLNGKINSSFLKNKKNAPKKSGRFLF